MEQRRTGRPDSTAVPFDAPADRADDMPPVIAWRDGAIEVIDQTLLPAALEVRRLGTVDEVVDAIRRLVVRGAPLIGACGALGVVLGLSEQHPGTVAEALTALDEVAARIGGARPTAVNPSWAVGRVREGARSGGSVEDMRRLAMRAATSIIDAERDASRRMGEHGRVVLAGRATILTHCNTGRLATPGVGTALAVVYAKKAAGEPVRVYACEARPLLQGARLTAWELLRAGIDVTLIVDGAAAGLLASGRVDAVLVGADRIAANGDTANKVGTLALALAARHAGVPFYVVAPTSSIDPTVPAGRAIPIEERDAEEVRTWRGLPAAPPEVPVWNPAFDVTPHDLITGFITERGVLRPPFGAAGSFPLPDRQAPS